MMADRAAGLERVGKTHPFAVLLWFLALAWVARVTIFVRPRSGAEFAEVDLSATFQILVTLLVLGLVLINSRTAKMWRSSARTSLRWLLLYYGACLLSAIWSPLPEYSAYRAVEYLSMLLGVSLAIFYAPTFEKAERAVIAVAALVVIMSLIQHVIVHGFSLSIARWHTNSYSASAAMLFVYCLGEFLHAVGRRRRLLGIAALGALFITALGTSTASNIGAIFGVVFIAVFSRSRKLLIAGLVGAVFFIPLSMAIGTESDSFSRTLLGGKSAEDVLELDNRRSLWERYWELYLASPLIGHGFAVTSTKRGGLLESAPHNSLLAVLLSTGIVGLVFVLAYGLRLAIELLGPARRGMLGSRGVLGAIPAGLVNSLGMPLIFDQYEESSLVFISFAALSVFWVVLPWRADSRKGKASGGVVAGGATARKKLGTNVPSAQRPDGNRVIGA
jgi:O-antigen ligase